MKICDLEKALTLSKERADAIKRLRSVNDWPFQLAPNYITIDRLSVMVINAGAFDRVKKTIVTLLQEEIDDRTQQLADLGALE